MKTDTNRLQQAVVNAAGERLEGKVVGEKEAAVNAEKAPSWQECEAKFVQMQASFWKGDAQTYRKLGAEYDALLKAYECNAEDGAFGVNVPISEGGPVARPDSPKPPCPPFASSAG